jgi:hypothetical protein
VIEYRFVPYISVGEKWIRIEKCEVERGFFGPRRGRWDYESICRPEDVEKFREHLNLGITYAHIPE